MTIDTLERQIVVHIHQGGGEVEQKSFFRNEVMAILHIDSTTFKEKQHPFWKADNIDAEVSPSEPKPRPRWDKEHLDYMVLVVNGLISEAEAADLWNMQKAARCNEARSKPMAGKLTGKKRKLA